MEEDEKIEDVNSKTDDTDQEADLENDEDSFEESEDDSDEVKTLKKKNQSLYEMMKKAKGFIRGDEGKWIKKPKPVEIKPVEPVQRSQEKDIDKLLDAKLEKRELESLDVSDELKKEVQTYAKVQGVSIKKALSSEYISFLKEKEEKKERIDNASLGSNRKSTTKKDYSKVKPTDFDLRTPEGKAEHAKYQEYLKEQLG